ncbi:hypothetical protein ACNR9Q_14290 [Maribacter sp. X9]|uniref:hypothetical protein n=1 Tax=Maribacter sp. X9 TaxID=3402159 RepID=UPI003AF3CFFA
MKEVQSQMTNGKFPFTTIIEITLVKTRPIIAPKYVLYPETPEKEQIERAKKIYGIWLLKNEVETIQLMGTIR